MVVIAHYLCRLKKPPLGKAVNPRRDDAGHPAEGTFFMEHPVEAPLLTPEEARTDPRFFNGKISRNAFYDAINRGDIPVITIGRRKFVVVARLRAMLQGEAA